MWVTLGSIISMTAFIVLWTALVDRSKHRKSLSPEDIRDFARVELGIDKVESVDFSEDSQAAILSSNRSRYVVFRVGDGISSRAIDGFDKIPQGLIEIRFDDLALPSLRLKMPVRNSEERSG
jgi:hypothetical protein